MAEFEGVQSNNTPPAEVYKDPMQWYYDLTPEQQEQHRAEKVALYRKVLEITGLSGVASNDMWVSPWNPNGMNPVVWAEYKRLTKV